MLRMLAWKESRELFPLIMLALIAQVYVLGAPAQLQFLNSSDGQIPFLSNDMPCFLIFVVAGAAAFSFGLWQTIWEGGRGTFQFLLHRPVTRDAIVLTKLAIGWTACLALGALPLAFHAGHAAMRGTHASPFEWSMTVWAWQVCLQIPLVYLGAFLSGLREARTFGSRFLPAAAGVLLLTGVQVLFPGQFLSAVIVSMFLQAVFVYVILYVATTRDYS